MVEIGGDVKNFKLADRAKRDIWNWPQLFTVHLLSFDSLVTSSFSSQLVLIWEVSSAEACVRA